MNYFFPIRHHHPSLSIFSSSGRFQEPQIRDQSYKTVTAASLSKWIIVNKNTQIVPTFKAFTRGHPTLTSSHHFCLHNKPGTVQHSCPTDKETEGVGVRGCCVVTQLERARSTQWPLLALTSSFCISIIMLLIGPCLINSVLLCLCSLYLDLSCFLAVN